MVPPSSAHGPMKIFAGTNSGRAKLEERRQDSRRQNLLIRSPPRDAGMRVRQGGADERRHVAPARLLC